MLELCTVIDLIVLVVLAGYLRRKSLEPPSHKLNKHGTTIHRKRK